MRSHYSLESEIIPLETQVDYAGRRYEGEKNEFWHKKR
jgi:hypothetical protein